jgi:hypothetical protein
MKRTSVSHALLPLATLAPITRIARHTGPQPGIRLTRGTLIKLGGPGLTAILTGAWKTRGAVAALPADTFARGASCVLSPEMTEGPYYIAREKYRRNIRGTILSTPTSAHSPPSPCATPPVAATSAQLHLV